ncbi:hypothetical protein RUM44_006273 [Polyplax serrata]|uniref:Uncharacterized protein n=1 Tax=Polyplax serrata TaxID=468196 RepID=A0ABR1AHM9_POLSC
MFSLSISNDLRSNDNSPALGQSSSITQKNYVTLISPEKVGDVNSKRVNKLNDMFDDSSLFETSTTVTNSRTPVYVSSFEKSAQKPSSEKTGFTRVTTHLYGNTLDDMSGGQVDSLDVSEKNGVSESHRSQPTEITTVEYYVADHNVTPSTLKAMADEIGDLGRMMRNQYITTTTTTTEYHPQQNSKLT